MTADPAYYLSIYIHAHKTGNNVPPHIEAEAEAALRLQGPQKITMNGFLATKEAVEEYLRDTDASTEAPVLTDEQILALSQHHMVSYAMSDGKVVYPLQEDSDMRDSVLSFARDLIARWGRPAITPIPVSERPWEREELCDAKGKCWVFDPGDHTSDPAWWFVVDEEIQQLRQAGTSLNPPIPVSRQKRLHCLPHWALPIPEQNSKNK